MIPAIIIISLAYYWLMLETDWLRVRLIIGELFLDAEIDTSGYDGSDGLCPDDLGAARQEAIENFKYDQWLEERYAGTYKYGSAPTNRMDDLCQIDKLAVIEDDLAQRRSGTAIYQRLGKTPRYIETAIGSRYQW